MPRALALSIVLLLASACDSASSPDAGIDAGADSGRVDATSDGGVDASSPYARWCSPCELDADCGEGSVCLFFSASERACGLPCASDADCGALSLEARCELEIEGSPLVCRPTAGTCVGSAPASACSGACVGTYDRCLTLEGLGPLCTTACTNDSECPIGMRRCRDTSEGRVCIPDEESAPERCARMDLRACTTDADCGADRCFGAGTLRRCLSSPTLEGCGDSALEAIAPDGSSVCVPSLPSLDRWDERISADCDCLLADEGAMLDEALARIGRDRCGMSFPHRYLDLFPPELAHDRFRLSWTDRVHAYWPAALRFGRHVGRELDSGRTPEAVLRAAASWADLPMNDDPITPSADLASALAALIEARGGTPDGADLSAQSAALPAGLATALVPVIDALREAVIAREEAIAIIHPSDRDIFFVSPSRLALDGAWTGVGRLEAQGVLLGDVDVGAMARAAVRLLAAIEAADLPSFAGTDAALTVETPAGRIAIRGSSDDTYEGDAWTGALLVLDLGGDDTYRVPAGATSSPEHGVSVLIDVSGADSYGYAEVPVPNDVGPEGHRRLPSDGAGRATPSAGRNGPQSRSTISRQGAGRLGIGLLLDLGAEGDRYRSLRMSQGFGSLGVGVLYDRAGDDVYEGESGVQGASSFGVGLLIDDAGNDQYVAYHAAQGFAYVRAVGVLLDRGGNDIYFAHPSDVLYVSPQDESSNSSFVQGVGFGRRADPAGDGVFMSGGLGVLRDRAGSDAYTAGVFAQATGYWYGTGMLLEGGGDDQYDAVWYVQSGDAHFAISVLLEDGGNDRYNPLSQRRNVAMGGGHDFSVAWFVDASGDDVYRAPGISYGSGNEGGAGIFADLAGTDSYEASGNNSFGHAAIERFDTDELRRATGTVGIFLEADGVDTYVRPTIGEVQNDATWQQSAHAAEANERGVGMDRTGGRTGLE